MSTPHTFDPRSDWDQDKTVQFGQRSLAGIARPPQHVGAPAAPQVRAPLPPGAGVGLAPSPHYGGPGFVPPGAPPAPGFDGYPPMPWPPGASPARSRRGWWLAAVIGVVVLALVITVVAVTSGGSATVTPTEAAPAAAEPAEPAAPPVAPSALPRLLFKAAEAEAAMGVSPAPFHDSKPSYDGLYDDVAADEECSVIYNATRAVYQGSGYTAVLSQSLVGKPYPGADDYRWRMPHTVSAFPDAQSASDFLEAVEAKWQRCTNRSFNARIVGNPDSYDNFWSVGQVSLSDGVLSSTMVEEGGGGWVCQRAMTAHNNVVLEFSACGKNLPDSVVASVVAAFTEKVDAL